MPVLYAARACPHSLRARMALRYAGIGHELVFAEPGAGLAALDGGLPDVPPPLLRIAPGEVLDRSLDILHWALLESDPDGWIDFEVDELDEMSALLNVCDDSFAGDVSSYRQACASGAPQAARQACRLFLDGLEQRLRRHRFLFGERMSYADAAVFPFVQAFVEADRAWFDASSYLYLKRWFGYHAQGPLLREIGETMVRPEPVPEST